jgi:hypothetical protein
MAFLDFLFGKHEKVDQIPKYNQAQENTMNQLLGGGSSQLPQGFEFLNQILSQNPDLMNQFQAPAKREFNEEILPTIAERFSGMNAQKSSAFGQQVGKAGERLEESLSAQRSGMQSNALAQLQSLLQGGLTQRNENVFRPGTEGFAQGAGASLAQILPYLLMM